MTAKQNIKLLFLGTPQFAAEALLGLYQASYDIAGVVTQPDRPSGRGKQLASSSVKKLALELNLPIFQPENKQALTDIVKRIQPDVAVVAAYGIIIEQAALDVPRYGFINIHGSILPKYRGASPIAEAILQGDTETGITIMHMDAGMDTGEIIKEHPIKIDKTATTESLTNEMAKLGAKAIVETLPIWIQGSTVSKPQDNSKASICRKIKKEDGHIDWSETANMVERKIRAYQPWPKAFTFIGSQRIQLLQAVVCETRLLKPGEIQTDHGLLIGTQDFDLLILKLQPEGKNPMSAEDFVRGKAIESKLITE